MKLDRIRLEYNHKELNIEDLNADPMQQFQLWMDDVLKADITYPNAVHFTTLGEDGYPQSRVVLLKEVTPQGFVFFTNYHSPKSKQLGAHPKVSLNFFWKEFDRQIRICGEVEKISRVESEAYFLSRPLESQYMAMASPQGEVITKEELQQRLAEAKKSEAKCPEFWGGYVLKPKSFEFWQGRPNRMHDRFRYLRAGKGWEIGRLAP